MTTYGLSQTDALSVLNQYAAGHYTQNIVPLPTTQVPATTSTSVASRIVSGTTVVAGGLAIAVLGYKLWTGYTFAKTAQGLWNDTKKGAAKVRSVFSRKGHRHNPLILPGRSSATGGRIVAYRVRLEEETVLFTGTKATLYRHGSEVASFKPSNFQKTKIRSSRGELLIFQDQLGGV
jgi:hypothetical protein